MRTTLDLPDDVMRAVKVRAAQSDRSLTDEITALLRSGLAQDDGTSGPRRVVLPLIRSTRQATEDEMSPERIAEILVAGDVQDLSH